MTRRSRRPDEREVADELAFHIEMRTRDLIARGLDPDTAKAQAEAHFRDRVATETVCAGLVRGRERRLRLRHIGASVLQDGAFAWRMLRRRRRFALVTIATMALAIAASVSIYSLVDGVLLRPLPFTEPHRLASIWLTDSTWRTDPVLSRMWDRIPLGRIEYDPVRAESRAFSELGMWRYAGAMLAGADGAQRVTAVRVTASLLPLLGVKPARGRLFHEGEDVFNGPKVAVLGWDIWRSRFGADDQIVGRTIEVDDTVYQVVGVLPEGVRLDRAGPPPALWLPAFQEEQDLAERKNRSFRAVGRLRKEATFDDASAEVASMFGTVATRRTDSIGARVESWQRDDTRLVRPSLLMLMGAAGLLLAIACVNIAMVTLAEAATRDREMASRVALGASSGRLVRQLLTESLLIAAVGGLIGGLLAWIGTGALIDLAPTGVPGLAEAGVNARALAVAATAVLAVGLVSGLAPALFLARRGASLVGSAPRHTSRGAARVQRVFVAVEVALSLTLLVGCGLLGHSLLKLRSVNVGFSPDQLVVVQVATPRAFDDARTRRYFTDAVAELAALPGGPQVTGSVTAPFVASPSSSPIFIEGGDDRGRSTQQLSVMADYFDVTRTPIVMGRGFTASDSASSDLVAVVSLTAARRDFGDASPLGRRVRWQGRFRTIVGVAGDVLFSRLSSDAQATIYAPFDQAPNDLMLILRTNAVTDVTLPIVRDRLRRIDPAVAIRSVDAMPTLIARSYAEERFRALLVTLFGVMASVLAGVGVFAVASRAVAVRLREAGIRVALGASSVAVGVAMASDLLKGVVAGLVVGALGATALARWIAPQLFAASPHDAVAFGAAALLIALAVAAALLPPLRRAINVNPVIALRAE